ncbi:MAG: hypothetical protein JEZ10_03570 [Verrucomicrobia bacterium]|nr:hypothetical protein [Verrucomicrobiota bacterium]
MKKLLTIIAVTGLISGFAFADSNVVSSANIVGYVQSATPPAGVFKIVALTQFSDGTTNNTVSIQDVIGNLSDLNADVAGSSAAGADKLHVYTGIGYSSYALFQPAAGDPYWLSTSDAEWFIPGYESTPPSTDTFSRGAAVWYATAAGGASTNMISSGDVYLDDTFSVTVPGGYSLLAYPYSSDITLDTLVISNATADVAGSSAASADKLHIYTGIGYESYALFQPATGDPYWLSTAAAEWFIPGYESTPPSTNTIGLGTGFWFETATGKTIGFEKIYTIN